MSRRDWVLLHGFAGRPASWDRVKGPLLDAGRVVCLEIVGHGGAESVARNRHGAHDEQLETWPVDFDGEVDRLAGQLRRQGVDGAHLVGYSLGGRLALGLLVRHPGLFSRATLVGVHPGLDSPAERRQRIASDARWAHLLEQEGLEPFLAAWEHQPLFASQGRLPEEVGREQRRLRRGLEARRLARAMRLLSLGRMPCYRSALSALDLPVELVVGALDGKFRRLAEQMTAALPRSRLTVVPAVGHNVVLEAPESLCRRLLAPEPGGREELWAGAGE